MLDNMLQISSNVLTPSPISAVQCELFGRRITAQLFAAEADA